jgi:hypothetical protein
MEEEEEDVVQDFVSSSSVDGARLIIEVGFDQNVNLEYVGRVAAKKTKAELAVLL